VVRLVAQTGRGALGGRPPGHRRQSDLRAQMAGVGHRVRPGRLPTMSPSCRCRRHQRQTRRAAPSSGARRAGHPSGPARRSRSARAGLTARSSTRMASTNASRTARTARRIACSRSGSQRPDIGLPLSSGSPPRSGASPVSRGRVRSAPGSGPWSPAPGARSRARHRATRTRTGRRCRHREWR